MWFLKDTAFLPNNEFLIYDMSMNVGDTLHTYGGDFLIADSVFIKNGRKRIRLQLQRGSYLLGFTTHNIQYYYNTIEFIEGVGTTRGF